MEHLIDKQNVTRLRTLLSSDNRHRTLVLVGAIVLIALISGAFMVFLTPVGGIAVLIAGVGALLMLRDLRWGFFALLGVICLLPFASLPFKIGFTPTFLDLVFGALYAVWAMRLITRQQDDLILTPLGLPVIVFIVLAVFSFVLGLSHASPSANDVRTFAEVMLGFGLFFLVVNSVRTDPGSFVRSSLLRQITAVAILGGAAEAAVGIMLYVLPQAWALRLLNPLGRLSYPVGEGALRYINDDPARPMRAIGSSVDPNILGALLVIVLTLATTQLFARRPVLPRWFVLLSTGAMGICLFLTYSRSSMLGAVVAVGVVALFRYRRLFILMAIAGLLLLLLPQTQAYIQNFIEGIQIQDRSTQMRMGEYADTWKLIQRYPWLGVGFVGTPDIDLYVGVASLYLAVAAQMGLVGLMAFLLVLAAYLIYVWRAWRKLPPDDAFEPFLLGYGAAVLGSMVSGVLDHTLLTYPHAVALLWLTLGLGTASARMAFANFSREFHIVEPPHS